MASASDCEIEYTQGGTATGSGYGSDRDTDNKVTLSYYKTSKGTKWGSSDKLVQVTFRPIAGLTKKDSKFNSSGTVSVTWYMTLTCNGSTVRYPSSGNKTASYKCFYGSTGEDEDDPGDPYCGFTWSTTTTFKITDATFLAGLVAGKNIVCQYYFPKNSNYCIINNAHAWVTAWTSNTEPSAPKINYPIANTTTYNTKPRFSMTGTDSNSDTLTYQYSMDKSTWTNLATSVTSGTTKTGQVSTSQSTGSKTLYIRTYDGNAYSSVASRSFTIGNTSLSVNAGDQIDDTIMDRAQSYITNLAAYYGDDAPSWTACDVGTKLNASQINDLNNKLKDLTPQQSFTVPSAGSTIVASLFATDINKAIKDS